MIEMTNNVSISGGFVPQQTEQTDGGVPSAHDANLNSANFFSVLYQMLLPANLPSIPVILKGEGEATKDAQGDALSMAAQTTRPAFSVGQLTVTTSLPISSPDGDFATGRGTLLGVSQILPQKHALLADEVGGRPLAQTNLKIEQIPVSSSLAAHQSEQEIVNWGNAQQPAPSGFQTDIQSSDKRQLPHEIFETLETHNDVRESRSSLTSEIPFSDVDPDDERSVPTSENEPVQVDKNRLRAHSEASVEPVRNSSAAAREAKPAEARTERVIAEQPSAQNIGPSVSTDQVMKAMMAEVTPDDFIMIDWNAGSPEKHTQPLQNSAETRNALQAVVDKFAVAMSMGKQLIGPAIEQGTRETKNVKLDSKSERKVTAHVASTDVIEWPLPETAKATTPRPVPQAAGVEDATENPNKASSAPSSTHIEGEGEIIEQANIQLHQVDKAEPSVRESTGPRASHTSPEVASIAGQSKTEPPSPGRAEGKASVQHPAIPEDFARNLVVKVSDELRAHIEGKSSEVRVMMKPESLGELSLRVTMENGKLAATMDVSQSAVRNALEAQLPQLREALASHGIDIQRFDIISTGETHSQQSKGGQPSHKHTRSKKHGLSEVEENIDATRFLGYNTVEYIV